MGDTPEPTTSSTTCDICAAVHPNEGAWPQEFRSAGGFHCRDCHKSWSGTRRAHCTMCHVTFESYTSADAHRVPGGTCMAIGRSRKIKFVATDSAFDAVWKVERQREEPSQ